MKSVYMDKIVTMIKGNSVWTILYNELEKELVNDREIEVSFVSGQNKIRVAQLTNLGYFLKQEIWGVSKDRTCRVKGIWVKA